MVKVMKGVILAGGRAKRFGEDKLLFKVGGKPLIMHTIEKLSGAKYIDELFIVTSEDRRKSFKKLGFEVLVDNLLVGPIGGIYTALKQIGDSFVVAGDMPLLNSKFIELIIEQFYKDKCIACVPIWENGYLEPLHAAYSKSFVKFLKEQIEKGDYTIRPAILKANTCYIKIEELPKEFRESFYNVNTKRDLKKVESLKQKSAIKNKKLYKPSHLLDLTLF